MKFESVRLLHAQNVPNHFVANQVYQPIDDDHQTSGSFLILLDHDSALSGAFAASLVTTLIRDYYRLRTQDRLSCFEQTLVRLNEQIKQYERAHEGTASTLNGTIVLCLGDEIHITSIGTAASYLFRGTTTIPLTDASAETSTTFSIITSGEIEENDVVVLTTGIGDISPVKPDLEFSLRQTPMYESGRAFARLLRNHTERAAEALFVRFDATMDSTYQIYVDRSLETRAEKISTYKEHAQRHFGHVVAGLDFVRERFPKRKTHSIATKVNDGEKPSTEPAMTFEDGTKDDLTANNALAPDYTVRHYRQANTIADTFAASTPAPITTHTFHISPSSLFDRLKSVNRRTWYILLGALILLFILGRITNSQPNTQTAEQSTEARDALIAKAEASTREAETAQVEDKTEEAITKLLETQTTLSQIAEKQKTEKSRALTNRATSMLTTLTKTQSVNGSSPITLPAQAKKIVASSSGSFVVTESNTLLKIADNQASIISGYPTNEPFIDAVPVDNGTKIAFLTKRSTNESVIHLYTLSANTFKEAIRSDSKPWGDIRLITSFETNLYPISTSMSKATPTTDATYRIISYPSAGTTDSVTSIVNNGFAFYAVDKEAKIERIAANSPRTPIKIYGVPEAFLPQKLQLIDSKKEGVLYLFDPSQKRMLILSTDGAYRGQLMLSSASPLTSCQATTTTLLCANDASQIILYTIPN